MRQNRDNNKLNNKGFSLVEVLVAVIILALVAGPILMAFVMSARFNARARENQRISTVAESVMEEFKGLSIKDARDPARSDYDDITPGGADFFRFAYEDFELDGQHYDVRVTATPMDDRSKATYGDSYIDAAPMDPYYDYVFTQDLYQDKQVYDRILNEAYTYLDEHADFSTAEPGVSASDLNKDRIKVNRVVNLSVTGNNDNQWVSVSFTYSFSLDNYPVAGHGNVSHTFTSIVVDVPAKSYKELNKVYLFYSPGYKSLAARNVAQIMSDTVVVTNDSSRPVEAYVIKQVNPLYTNLYTCDSEYTPTVYANGSGAVTLHSHIQDSDSVTDFNDHLNDSLLYTISVDVYEAGQRAAGFTGTPLYTLNGSINSKEN